MEKKDEEEASMGTSAASEKQAKAIKSQGEIVPLSSTFSEALMASQVGSNQTVGEINRGGGWQSSSNRESMDREMIDNVDFVGPADSMKALFRLPYSTEGVSVALHKMGEMLIVDGQLDELYQAAAEGPSVSSQEVPYSPTEERRYEDDGSLNKTTTPSSSSSQGKEGREDGDAGKQEEAHEGQQRQILKRSVTSSSSASDAVNKKCLIRPASFNVPPPPFHLPPIPRVYPQLLHFHLHGLNMLMGSELKIFSNTEHPAVSTVFTEAERGLEFFTCLDAYLENVFANIPELAVCMTSKGYIRSCSLVRTEEIPNLSLGPEGPFATKSSKGPLFDPKMIDLNATTLLRFLKENCATEGHSYLLHREEGGKTVQLYDVTALSTQRQKRWKWLLAMLAYRFAMRMYQQVHLFGKKLRAQLQLRHRRLLQTCLLLLQELTVMSSSPSSTADEDHPHHRSGAGQHESLCAAVQEQLADSYLGSGGGGGAHSSRNTSSATGASTSASNGGGFKKGGGSDGRGAGEGGGERGKVKLVAEADLCKAQQHLLEGIDILRPLLRATEEEEDDFLVDEEEEDVVEERGGGRREEIVQQQQEQTEIAFGSFSSPEGAVPPPSPSLRSSSSCSSSSSSSSPSPPHRRRRSRDADKTEEEREQQIGDRSSSNSNGRASSHHHHHHHHHHSTPPTASALMVSEQMLGLRQKLVHTLRQLIQVYLKRRELLGVIELVKRAMHEIVDAAALVGLHHYHPQHHHRRTTKVKEESRGEGGGHPSASPPSIREAEKLLRRRVRAWAEEAARDLWSVGADLAHTLAVGSMPSDGDASSSSSNTAIVSDDEKEQQAGGSSNAVADGQGGSKKKKRKGGSGGGAAKGRGEGTSALPIEGEIIDLLVQMEDGFRQAAVLGSSSNHHLHHHQRPSRSPSPCPSASSSTTTTSCSSSSSSFPPTDSLGILSQALLRSLALLYLQPHQSLSSCSLILDSPVHEAALNAAAATTTTTGTGTSTSSSAPSASASPHSRSRKLLLVASALAYARATRNLTTTEEGGEGEGEAAVIAGANSIRRLGDACNEVGKSLRESLFSLNTTLKSLLAATSQQCQQQEVADPSSSSSTDDTQQQQVDGRSSSSASSSSTTTSSIEQQQVDPSSPSTDDQLQQRQEEEANSPSPPCPSSSSADNITIIREAMSLCLQAGRWWFHHGVHFFTSVGDGSNIARVYLNVVGLAKVAASARLPYLPYSSKEGGSSFSSSSVSSGRKEGDGSSSCSPLSSSPTSATEKDSKSNKMEEKWLEEDAMTACQKAHLALSDREIDITIWDAVSEEMAMIHLMLGVSRRQALLNPSSSSSSEGAGGGKGGFFEGGSLLPVSALQEKAVVEPLQHALRLYTDLANSGSKTGTTNSSSSIKGCTSNSRNATSSNSRTITTSTRNQHAQHQIAAVHYQLGAFYSKIWLVQKDKRRAREKLALALHHYNQAFVYFYQHQSTSSSSSSTLLLIIMDLSHLYLTVDTATSSATAASAGSSSATSTDPMCLTQAVECLLKARRVGIMIEATGEERKEGKEIRARLAKALLGLIKYHAARGREDVGREEKVAKLKSMYRMVLESRAAVVGREVSSKEEKGLDSLLEELWKVYYSKSSKEAEGSRKGVDTGEGKEGERGGSHSSPSSSSPGKSGK